MFGAYVLMPEEREQGEPYMSGGGSQVDEILKTQKSEREEKRSVFV